MSDKIFTEIQQYERARLRFCQIIAEAATRPHHISYMDSEKVIELIYPLLSDPEMAVRSNSVCCISRMANRSEIVAKKLVDLRVPEIILNELSLERNNNVHYHRAVMQILKAIAKNSNDLAQNVIDCGGLSAFLICLESTDPLLRENACCGIGCIVQQSSNFAMLAIKQGVLPLLLMNIQHKEVSLKQIATLALSDIAKHSSEHGDEIVRADGLAHLAGHIDNVDVKLKKHTLMTLGNISSHSPELATHISQWNILPKALIHLGHDSGIIQKHSARLIQEVVKHNLELAQIVVNDGGIGAIVQMLFNASNQKEDVITPGATALGYIAGQSPHFAIAIIESNGVIALALLLNGNKTSCQIASCAWAIGHIGKHSSEHCSVIAEANIFVKIMEIFDTTTNVDLRTKLRDSLKMCVRCCLHVPALDMLLYESSKDILEIVLEQLNKILPSNDIARRMFLTTGSLRKILALEPEPGSNIANLLNGIKSCFSNEVIKMYSPKKMEMLPDDTNHVLQFKPQDFFINPNVDDGISIDSSLKSSIA